MEDSYTVHRRRKAAARRREKTPEPPRRHQDDVAATDEEEEARVRMERLVQETEMLEEREEVERRRAKEEKSGDYAASSVAEKPQRALKRAMSPEVRRKDEETHEENELPESKLPVELSSSVVPTDFDKLNSGSKGLRGETIKASSAPGESEIEKQSIDSVGEVARKPKKGDTELTPIRTVKRCTDVDRDLSPRVIEKPARSSMKALSPDVERIGKNRTGGEWSGEVASNENSVWKKSLRAGDDEEEEKQAAALDKNRYEAAPVARESDVEHMRFVSSGRDETVKQENLERDEDEHNKSSRHLKDSPSTKKRDVASLSKTRNLESRATTTTTKRFGKERNVERTGYTTDSSETEQIAKRVPRRKKSPEGAKSRNTSARKTPSRSRATTDTDGDVEEPERSKRTEKRSTSRRRPTSDSDEDSNLKKRTSSPSYSTLERREVPQGVSKHGENFRRGEIRSTSRPRPPSDTDEDLRPMRKSDTFPIDPPRDTSPSVARSSSEIKKQIIPLSNDSLIEDFERAQREYLKKERGILDPDPLDDYVDPKMKTALRRRKFSIIKTESESQEVMQQVEQPEKRSWLSWLPFFGRKTKKKGMENDEVEETKVEDEKQPENIKEESKKVLKEEIPSSKKVSILEFFRTLADFVSEFRAFVEQNPREIRTIRIMRNRCLVELLLAIIYCGLGAFLFRFTEGAFEMFYKCGVKRVKRDFLDSLWNFSHNMREEDWKSMARRKLMEFEEQLHTAHEAGVHSYSGQKSWSFLNAVVYCLTVITTIGYGHISPSTTTGRAITIIYAIFGIPMFLIILADFGKLFTRGIKFLWAFVRRVYYTGSCRRVRRTVPMQEVMKGVQLVYDLATFRRPSQMNPEEIEEMQKHQNQTQTVLNLDGNTSPTVQQADTPGTPAMSTFAIDDEFNLPISVAIVILLVYIFVGATVYNFWEKWGFFESFYFVFISMSTIGFGDYVPKHPIYMMLSIVYLVFGLALTSMCINVVQVMLSDSFKQASQKIGATIGFEVAEDDESVESAAPPPVEIADVHATIKESESKEQVAPKAKQEDIEL